MSCHGRAGIRFTGPSPLGSIIRYLSVLVVLQSGQALESAISKASRAFLQHSSGSSLTGVLRNSATSTVHNTGKHDASSHEVKSMPEEVEEAINAWKSQFNLAPATVASSDPVGNQEPEEAHLEEKQLEEATADSVHKEVEERTTVEPTAASYPVEAAHEPDWIAQAAQEPDWIAQASEEVWQNPIMDDSLVEVAQGVDGLGLSALNAGCNDKLSGVNRDDAQTVFNHGASSHWKQAQVAKHKYPVLANKTYFIAACLHQSGAILNQWSTELTKFILAIMNTEGSNVFLSVYESGSTDGTKEYLAVLGAALKALGVQNKINLGTLEKGRHENRIDFIAKIRNRAMDPIYTLDKTMHFDRVMWFNDDLFCASGPLQQMLLTEDPQHGGSGADAACGMDFDTYKPNDNKPKECGFYDVWVAHDMGGQRFTKPFPYTAFGPSTQAVASGHAFQVFSCWGGMVAFRADIFTKQKLTFRKGREDQGECRASEAELIFHDMWKIGRGNIVVAPNSLSAYNRVDYERCVQGKQKAILTQQTVLYRADPPPAVTCCPIDKVGHWVNFKHCRMDTWEDPYDSADVPRRAGAFLQEGGLQNKFPKGTRAVLLPLSHKGPAHPYNGTRYLKM